MPWALLSVSNKFGIADFARQLHQSGFSILASGGTKTLLTQESIQCTEVSDLTGFPEIMDGRVKTLHPKVHGGILGRRDRDQQVMEQHNIPVIDIVVVNLYPFADTLKAHPKDHNRLVENIDIGGSTLIRSAAKNHHWVCVVTDPSDYPALIVALQTSDGITPAMRQKLATKAFSQCSHYDYMIANWLTNQCDNDTSNTQEPAQISLPDTCTINARRAIELRYGENPHQQAGLYLHSSNQGWGSMQQHHGKPLSYNNIADSEQALRCVTDLQDSACVIVKHSNPCGVACDNNQNTAYTKAFASDPESAFGGIVAFNRPISADVITTIINNQFVEVILAPALSEDVSLVVANKPNIRIITLSLSSDQRQIRSISGGLLIQQAGNDSQPEHQHITGLQPDSDQQKNIAQAWSVVKHIKSNAILLYKHGQSIGIGAGQTSRIQSLRIAIAQAQAKNFDTNGAVMASDAFLPFADSVTYCAEHGINHIIQTGGSLRDAEVIAEAERHNIGMTFTGMRYFFH